MPIRPPAPRAPEPVAVSKSDGDMAAGVVANTWHDLDTTGSANARSYDLVVPNVRAGQTVMVGINARSPSTAAAVYLDFWTVVAGTPVNPLSNSTVGTFGWALTASALSSAVGAVPYVVQAGDIENGAVRFRLRDRNTTTTARSLLGTSGARIWMWAHGPF